MTGRRNSAEAGFSLVEVLVALVVFSLGAVALLNVIGESARSQSASDARAIARVIAENRMVEAMALATPPGPGVSSGQEEAMLRTWRWEQAVTPTQNPRILRIDIRVSAGDAPQTLAELTSFRSLQ